MPPGPTPAEKAAIRDDYELWSGGFPPASAEEVQVYMDYGPGRPAGPGRGPGVAADADRRVDSVGHPTAAQVGRSPPVPHLGVSNRR
jgi:hypothetical protein